MSDTNCVARPRNSRSRFAVLSGQLTWIGDLAMAFDYSPVQWAATDFEVSACHAFTRIRLLTRVTCRPTCAS